MKRFCGFGILALACAVVLSTFARAENPFAKDLSDKDFVTWAATNGSAEVKMSELADKRVRSEQVMEFAKSMAGYHGKLNKQLEEVAKAMGASAVPVLDKDIRGTLDGLTALKGAEFDRAYITRMVQDHQKSMKLFESQAERTTNADLKKFCNDALPKLAEHLKEARNIADGLKK
jgi:putative membrane protein